MLPALVLAELVLPVLAELTERVLAMLVLAELIAVEVTARVPAGAAPSEPPAKAAEVNLLDLRAVLRSRAQRARPRLAPGKPPACRSPRAHPPQQQTS